VPVGCFDVKLSRESWLDFGANFMGEFLLYVTRTAAMLESNKVRFVLALSLKSFSLSAWFASFVEKLLLKSSQS
jgi:hypothetical protein